MADKIQLTVSSLLQDLQDGLTRDEIAVKYGMKKSQVKQVFKHPKLKFKKTIKPKDAAFVLTDDVPDVVENQLSMDLPEGEVAVPTPVTAEPETAEPVIVEEPADAYTQPGVEITDDTITPTPTVTETPGAW